MNNEAIKSLLKAIDGVHKAFGAPGDYGYSTPQGQALYALYVAQLEAKRFVAAQQSA